MCVIIFLGDVTFEVSLVNFDFLRSLYMCCQCDSIFGNIIFLEESFSVI